MFNKKIIEAFKTGIFTCDECGARMEAIDEDEYYCPACGYVTDIEHYGYSEEEYENLYPSMEDVLELYDTEEDDEFNGEYYEEECDELSHDD